MTIVCLFILPPLLILAGLWGATQWTAALLHQASHLGPAWLHVGGWPIYLPWQFVGWFLRYGTVCPGRLPDPACSCWGASASA